MPHFVNDAEQDRTMRLSDGQFDVLVELLKPVHILAIKQLEAMGFGPDGQPERPPEPAPADDTAPI